MGWDFQGTLDLMLSLLLAIRNRLNPFSMVKDLNSGTNPRDKFRLLFVSASKRCGTLDDDNKEHSFFYYYLSSIGRICGRRG